MAPSTFTRLTAALSCAVLLIAAGSLPAADAARAKTCRDRAKGHKVVARSRHAVIYTTDGYDHYGCWSATGRSHRIAVAPTGIRAVQFKRQFAAFVVVDEDTAGPGLAEKLYVVDLRAGRRVALGDALVDGRDGSSYTVPSYVLAASGAAAYITEHGGVSSDRQGAVVPNYAVRTIRPRRAGFAELDRGEDIDPRSLRRDARTVSWTRGGVVKSAPFGS